MLLHKIVPIKFIILGRKKFRHTQKNLFFILFFIFLFFATEKRILNFYATFLNFFTAPAKKYKNKRRNRYLFYGAEMKGI